MSLSFVASIFAPAPILLFDPGGHGLRHLRWGKFTPLRAFLQRRLDELIKHLYHHPFAPIDDKRREMVLNKEKIF